MSVSPATDIIRGPRVLVDFRGGTNVRMFEVNVVGRNGTEVVFYTLFVRMWRNPAGAVTGSMVMLPVNVPGWTVAPVLDSTLTGVRITVGVDGPNWISTMRDGLIATV